MIDLLLWVCLVDANIFQYTTHTASASATEPASKQAEKRERGGGEDAIAQRRWRSKRHLPVNCERTAVMRYVKFVWQHLNVSHRLFAELLSSFVLLES